MIPVIGLDPGTEQSAVVILRGEVVTLHATIPNPTVLEWLLEDFKQFHNAVLVIEQIESQGMAVGRETFETVFWSGRFAQIWAHNFRRVTRRQVKLHLCQSMRATDANIRQAIIDRYALTKAEAIGKKKTPGPLYGIKGHEFAALAVALTYFDQQEAPL